MMTELIYTTKDKSIQIKVVFIVAHPLKMYYVGKTWPKTTQCLIFVNGLLRSFGTVVKHNVDEDNPKYAYKGAMNKALVDMDSQLIKSQVPQIVGNALQSGELK